MWVIITNQRVLSKDTPFIQEIHVDNVTNDVSKILIELGHSMKRIEEGDYEEVNLNEDNKDIHQLLEENTPKVKLSNAKIEDIISKESLDELAAKAKANKWRTL